MSLCNSLSLASYASGQNPLTMFSAVPRARGPPGTEEERRQPARPAGWTAGNISSLTRNDRSTVAGRPSVVEEWVKERVCERESWVYLVHCQ